MSRCNQSFRRFLVIAACAVTAVGCKSSSSNSTTPVELSRAALFSTDPGTVVPGTPLQRTASCPGNTFPDQCGSWEGVELDSSTADGSADQHCFCRAISFQVPASLPVKKGNAGTGDTFLTFRKAGVIQKCVYHGNARLGQSGKMTGGDAYALVNCTDGSKAGSTVKADWFSLEVHGGDQTKGPTEVSLRLGAPDVVNGVVQEEIVYASDSRIPGAALHIPRGSVPPNQDFSIAVLPQPAVGSTVANGGDPAVMLGYAVDFHATGVDHFAFANVPGATCPKIDLPYSPAALGAFAGAGADSRVRARQITDLAAAASGANVLVPTSDVTVDPVNHLVSFCVSHLSFYASMGKPLDATLTYAYLTTSVHSCSSVADCNAGEVCNAGNCDLDLFAGTPTLLPDRNYVLHLSFHNSGSTAWSATDVGLWTVTPKPAMKLMQTAWHANAPQLLSSPVGQGQDASFDVDVTTPTTENEPDAAAYPYGSALDLCLVNAPQSDAAPIFAPFGECFSWEPSHSVANSGAKKVPLTDVCGDNADNDDDGTIDDPDGNPLHKAGASCDNGQSGTCQRTGHYVCDGLFATKCDAPIPPRNSCGGCAQLSQEPNTACDTGQTVDVCPVPGLAQCDGMDAVKCVPQSVPLNACGGCVDLGVQLGDACDTGGKGACSASGHWICNGVDSVSCNPSVNPTPEICNGIDDDCNGLIDETCPFDVGYSQFLNDEIWSPWFGPGGDTGIFSGDFYYAVCPVESNGQTFASGLSLHTGALVDSIDALHCSEIDLIKDTSVIPYSYRISLLPHSTEIGAHTGGPGGGPRTIDCDPPGLLTGIRGSANGAEIVSLGVECTHVAIINGTMPQMSQVDRYWIGDFGGQTGTPFSFECGPNQYVTYVEAFTTSETPNTGFLKNIVISCAEIGVRD
jgi:hypothetical protein